VPLPGGPALVGYQSKFRFRWVATKLHLFTVVIAVPEVTREILDSVTTQAIDYAKKKRGKLRGFQTGVAVIPIVAGSHVQPDARAAVEERPAKIFALILLPAIADLETAETYTYRGRLVFGAIYTAWLRERQKVVLPA
jgi:hypothetical protein